MLSVALVCAHTTRRQIPEGSAGSIPTEGRHPNPGYAHTAGTPGALGSPFGSFSAGIDSSLGGSFGFLIVCPQALVNRNRTSGAARRHLRDPTWAVCRGVLCSKRRNSAQGQSRSNPQEIPIWSVVQEARSRFGAFRGRNWGFTFGGHLWYKSPLLLIPASGLIPCVPGHMEGFPRSAGHIGCARGGEGGRPKRGDL